jgi:hypothetical protein
MMPSNIRENVGYTCLLYTDTYYARSNTLTVKRVTARGFRDKNDFVPKQFTLQVSPQAVYIVFDELLDIFRSVRVVAKSAYYLRHVRPVACIGQAPTGRISIKLYTGDFYDNLSRHTIFGYNRTKNRVLYMIT